MSFALTYNSNFCVNKMICKFKKPCLQKTMKLKSMQHNNVSLYFNQNLNCNFLKVSANFDNQQFYLRVTLGSNKLI